MRKMISEQTAKFPLFALPCIWPAILLFIVLTFMKAEIQNPAVIVVALMNAAIIAAAVLLVKKQYWICIPMIALGLYIALQDDQHFGQILQFYGIYLMLHYLASGVHVYQSRKGHSQDSVLIATGYLAILFALSLSLC